MSIRRSTRSLAATVVLGAIVVATGIPGAEAAASGAKHQEATAILEWTRLAEGVVAEGRGPGPAQVLMATVQVAIHDTVAAVKGGSKPYVATPKIRGPVSLEAAVATAAHGVLVARVPGSAVDVGRAYRRFLRSIPGSRSKLNGIDLGVEVADAVIALRSADGLGDDVPFIQPTPGPGVFEPVTSSPPIGTDLALVTPFAMSSPDMFRPSGPWPLDGPEYAADFNEVKDLGRVDSDARSETQTQTALFWSEHGFLQLSRTLRGIATDRRLSAADLSRLLAIVHVAAADAGIACFDAKYHYVFWRPIHAVQKAATDGNDATHADDSWEPLLNANHPEYPAGAACVNSAIFTALAEHFGTDEVSFEIDSTVTGTTRVYERFSAALADDLNARVWGGLHFRKSVNDGAELGHHVAQLVSSTLFHKTKSHG